MRSSSHASPASCERAGAAAASSEDAAGGHASPAAPLVEPAALAAAADAPVVDVGWAQVERILAVVRRCSEAAPKAPGAAAAHGGGAGQAAEGLPLAAALEVLGMPDPSALADGATAVRQRYLELSVVVHPDKCRHLRAADAFAALTAALTAARRAAVAAAEAVRGGHVVPPGSAAASTLYTIEADGTIRIPPDAKKPLRPPSTPSTAPAAATARASPAAEPAKEPAPDKGCVKSALATQPAGSVDHATCATQGDGGSGHDPGEGALVVVSPTGTAPPVGRGATLGLPLRAVRVRGAAPENRTRRVVAALEVSHAVLLDLCGGATPWPTPAPPPPPPPQQQGRAGTTADPAAGAEAHGDAMPYLLVLLEPEDGHAATGAAGTPAGGRSAASGAASRAGAKAAAKGPCAVAAAVTAAVVVSGASFLRDGAAAATATCGAADVAAQAEAGGAGRASAAASRGALTEAFARPPAQVCGARWCVAGPERVLPALRRMAQLAATGRWPQPCTHVSGTTATAPHATGACQFPLRPAACGKAPAEQGLGDAADAVLAATDAVASAADTAAAVAAEEATAAAAAAASAAAAAGPASCSTTDRAEAAAPYDIEWAEAAALYDMEVRAAVLMPCAAALRGGFPLNGTFFQTNELFLVAHTALEPLRFRLAQLLGLPPPPRSPLPPPLPPRSLRTLRAAAPPATTCSTPPPPSRADAPRSTPTPLAPGPEPAAQPLPRHGAAAAAEPAARWPSLCVAPPARRTVHLGSATSVITRDMGAAEVASLFDAGAVCVRGFCFYSGYPRPLPAFLAAPGGGGGRAADKGAGGKGGGGSRRTAADAGMDSE